MSDFTDEDWTLVETETNQRGADWVYSKVFTALQETLLNYSKMAKAYNETYDSWLASEERAAQAEIKLATLEAKAALAQEFETRAKLVEDQLQSFMEFVNKSNDYVFRQAATIDDMLHKAKRGERLTTVELEMGVMRRELFEERRKVRELEAKLSEAKV